MEARQRVAAAPPITATTGGSLRGGEVGDGWIRQPLYGFEAVGARGRRLERIDGGRGHGFPAELQREQKGGAGGRRLPARERRSQDGTLGSGGKAWLRARMMRPWVVNVDGF
ncbi:hypothetical protein VPH35_110976 [Triticum aestivum]